jgi:hypothetical protein
MDGEHLLVIALAVIASTGFWEFLKFIFQNVIFKPKLTPEIRLLRGIGQIEIIFFGTKFLEQGYITTEEYDSLKNEIYAPYLEIGGNGLAKKMMEEIEKLPIK